MRTYREDILFEENEKLRSKLITIQTSPFIVGEFFMEDGLTPRKSILICPMVGSDALYDYVKKEKGYENGN